MNNCNNFFKCPGRFSSLLLSRLRSARLNHNLGPGVRRGPGAVGSQSHGDAGDRPPNYGCYRHLGPKGPKSVGCDRLSANRSRSDDLDLQSMGPRGPLEKARETGPRATVSLTFIVGRGPVPRQPRATERRETKKRGQEQETKSALGRLQKSRISAKMFYQLKIYADRTR